MNTRKTLFLVKTKEQLAKMINHNKAYSKYFRFELKNAKGDIVKENKNNIEFVSKRYWAASKSKSRIR